MRFEFVPPEAVDTVAEWTARARLREVRPNEWAGGEVDDVTLEALSESVPVAFVASTTLDDGMPGLVALAAPGHWWSGMGADGQPALTAEAWREIRDDPAMSYSEAAQLLRADEMLGLDVLDEVRQWSQALWMEGVATDSGWVLARALLSPPEVRGAVQVAVAAPAGGARAWRTPSYQHPELLGSCARALLVEGGRWWALDLSQLGDAAADPLAVEVTCRQVASGQFDETAVPAAQGPA